MEKNNEFIKANIGTSLGAVFYVFECLDIQMAIKDREF